MCPCRVQQLAFTVILFDFSLVNHSTFLFYQSYSLHSQSIDSGALRWSEVPMSSWLLASIFNKHHGAFPLRFSKLLRFFFFPVTFIKPRCSILNKSTLKTLLCYNAYKGIDTIKKMLLCWWDYLQCQPRPGSTASLKPLGMILLFIYCWEGGFLAVFMQHLPQSPD